MYHLSIEIDIENTNNWGSGWGLQKREYYAIDTKEKWTKSKNRENNDKKIKNREY